MLGTTHSIYFLHCLPYVDDDEGFAGIVESSTVKGAGDYRVGCRVVAQTAGSYIRHRIELRLRQFVRICSTAVSVSTEEAIHRLSRLNFFVVFD